MMQFFHYLVRLIDFNYEHFVDAPIERKHFHRKSSENIARIITITIIVTYIITGLTSLFD